METTKRQENLIHVRLVGLANEAAQLLRSKNINISEVARNAIIEKAAEVQRLKFVKQDRTLE
jgi:post-segregation antitoxin (ccd killing protein)